MLSFRRRSSSRPMPATLVPVSLVTPPALLTAAIEGQSMSASQGTYAGTAPISLSWQWQISDNGVSGWTPTDGATSLTRPALTALEVNKYVRLAETASNALGPAATQYTAASQVTAANPPGTGTATITFTPTPGVTSYEVAWGPEHDSEARSNQYTGVTDTITVTGLESGTLYFKVRPLPGGDWYSLGPLVIA